MPPAVLGSPHAVPFASPPSDRERSCTFLAGLLGEAGRLNLSSSRHCTPWSLPTCLPPLATPLSQSHMIQCGSTPKKLPKSSTLRAVRGPPRGFPITLGYTCLPLPSWKYAAWPLSAVPHTCVFKGICDDYHPGSLPVRKSWTSTRI